MKGMTTFAGVVAIVVVSETCSQTENWSLSNSVLALAVNALIRNNPAWTPMPPVPMNSGAPLLSTVWPVDVSEARSSWFWMPCRSVCSPVV